MKKTLIIFFLMCGVCIAQSFNEKYSYRDFMNQSFKHIDVSEFNNTTIVGSNFYQEWKEGDRDVVKDIFPDGMTGVVFEKCNLDNVFVPDGNIVIGGANRKIKVQNDLEDWVLDETLKAKEPVSKGEYERLGVSADPKDIPKEKQAKSVLEKKREKISTSLNP